MAINWHPHWNTVVWPPNKTPPKTTTKRSCFKGPKEDLNRCRASFPLLTTDHLHFHRLLEKYLEIWEPKDLLWVLRPWEAYSATSAFKSFYEDGFLSHPLLDHDVNVIARSFQCLAQENRRDDPNDLGNFKKAVELAWKPCVCVSMSSANLAEYAGGKRPKAISICYFSLARNVFINVNTMPK